MWQHLSIRIKFRDRMSSLSSCCNHFLQYLIVVSVVYSISYPHYLVECRSATAYEFQTSGSHHHRMIHDQPHSSSSSSSHQMVMEPLIENLQSEQDVIPEQLIVKPTRDLGANISRILNAFFDHGYDKRVRPKYGGPPVEVLVSMYIVDISSVSEVLMDFTSDFYFRQAWTDTRLSFEARPGIDSLSVGAEVADRIWVPDTFFANEKSAYFHVATTPNTFLRINSKGEVFRSMR